MLGFPPIATRNCRLNFRIIFKCTGHTESTPYSNDRTHWDPALFGLSYWLGSWKDNMVQQQTYATRQTVHFTVSFFKWSIEPVLFCYIQESIYSSGALEHIFACYELMFHVVMSFAWWWSHAFCVFAKSHDIWHNGVWNTFSIPKIFCCCFKPIIDFNFMLGDIRNPFSLCQECLDILYLATNNFVLLIVYFHINKSMGSCPDRSCWPQKLV